MYYLTIGNNGAGFTNQIFALVGGIRFAYRLGERIIIVDHFLNDITNTTFSPITEIFDIKKINDYLYDNYGIIILDKYNTKIDILSVKYGTDETNYIDITEYIKTKYFNTILSIDKNCVFNDIKGDPCPGIVKHIVLKYKLNDYIIQEKYSENLNYNIEIKFDGNYIFGVGLINSAHNNMFDNVLKNIEYNPELIMKTETIMKNININKKINIIHLRLEDDGILHWSKQNNMPFSSYKDYLENKYINIIKKYISPLDQNIILSSSLSNGVVDFLNHHNYNYRFIDKYFKDREKNAIIDLLISKCCNNIFIGNYNMKNMNGSVFSYYIWKLITDDVTKIYIDLDHIYHDEVVHI
jgi:hypothetical protein